MKRLLVALLAVLLLSACEPVPAEDRSTDASRDGVKCAFGDHDACVRIGSDYR